MHSAPPVTYPVRRSRTARLLWLGGWALGVVVTAAWILSAEAFGWRHAAAVAASAAVAAFAIVGASRPDPRAGGETSLVWDGQFWALVGVSPAAEAASLSIHLDLQSALLLRLGRGVRSHWVWLDAATRPERWMDLRRAAYSPPPPASRHRDVAAGSSAAPS